MGLFSGELLPFMAEGVFQVTIDLFMSGINILLSKFFHHQSKHTV